MFVISVKDQHNKRHKQIYLHIYFALLYYFYCFLFGGYIYKVYFYIC